MTTTRTLIRTPATVAWLALMIATCISWWLGTGHGGSAELATVLVVAVAFVKVRIVGSYFMELREAPLPLRLLFDAWVVVVCSAVVAIYLVA